MYPGAYSLRHLGYIFNLPNAVSKKHAYADDLAIMHACGDWQAMEGVLSKDVATLGEYLQTCKLKLRTRKTVSAAFHLKNKEAKRELKSNTTTNPAILLRTQIPRSNFGQVVHVPPPPCVTSQEADIMRRTLRRLAASGRGSRATTLRIVTTQSTARLLGATVLITTSSTPCELLLDACVLRQRTTFQPSHVCNLLSFVAVESPCLLHAVEWSLEICSTDSSPVHRVRTHGASNRDTHFYPAHSNSSVYRTTYVRCSGRWNVEWTDSPTRLRSFIPDTGTHLPGMTLPRKACVGLNRVRAGVGRFRSCLYKWGMASSAACERGTEEQTVDHVVLQCPIHRPPHGLHGLTVLDDETMEWLINTCHKILCGQAVVSTTRSNERRRT